MKLETRTRSLQAQGVKSNTAFAIRSSAKAFEILSSGLYSDKVRAVVRELGTNAFDSQYEATKARLGGTPTRAQVIGAMDPFEVHLPNQLEPWFSVKDTGKGLSDIEVRGEPQEVLDENDQPTGEVVYAGGIYATYFDSDKTTSNDLTGCLGLGSKSPFAYTDQFTVTAIKDGEKNIYNAFVNEDGEPEISLLHNSKTTEPNGVEVKFSVKADDFEKFYNKSKVVFRWFEVRPTIVGIDHEMEYPDTDFLYRGEDYALAEGGHRSNNDSYLIMGNVAYPINTDDLDPRIVEKLSETEKSLLDHGTYIWVNLGEAEPAASREKLQMNRRTLDTVRQYVGKVAEHIKRDIRQAIEGQPTYHKARLQFYELIIGKDFIKTLLINANAGEFTWQGVPVTHQIKCYKEVGTGQFEPSIFGDDGEQIEKTSKVPIVRCLEFYKKDGRRWNTWSWAKQDAGEIQISPNVVFFVGDLKRGNQAAVRRWLTNEADRNVSVAYLLEEIDGEQVLDGFLKKYYLDDLVTKTSEVPVEDKTTVDGGPRKKTAKAVKCTWDFDYHVQSSTWQDTEVDLDAGGVYVEVNRYKVSCGELLTPRRTNATPEDTSGEKVWLKPYYLRDHATNARHLFELPELIGIRSSLLHKVEDHPKWVRLDEFIGKKMEELVEAYVDCQRSKAYQNATLPFKGGHINFFENKTFAPDSIFGEYVAKLISLQKLLKDEEVNTLKEALGHWPKMIDTPEVDTQYEIDKLADLSVELLKTYPMIRAMAGDQRYRPSDASVIGNHVDEVCEYVNLIDGLEVVQEVSDEAEEVAA